MRAHMRVTVLAAPAERGLVPKTFADLTSATDRYNYALQLLVQRAKAKAGYLYLLQDDGLKLVAATSPNEPPIGFETELLYSAEQGGASEPPRSQLDEEDEVATQMIDLSSAQLTVPEYSIAMLTLQRDDLPVVVGGVILEAGERSSLDAAFLQDVAMALHDRAAISTAF
jgi:hypothetical protein